VNVAHYNLAAPNALPPENHKVVLDFTYDGGGIGKGGTATINVDANKSPGPR
jgi:arylsulfatase